MQLFSESPSISTFCFKTSDLAPPPGHGSASVSGLRVKLLADVADDLGHELVKVVELVHEEGVLLVGVRGDVLQLVLGRPGHAHGVGDHTWRTEGGRLKRDGNTTSPKVTKRTLTRANPEPCGRPLTLALDGQGGLPDVVVGASVRDHDHDLAFVGFGLAEELLGGKGDGGAGAGAAAPVVDTLDGVEQVGLVGVLAEGELQPLLVGVLHRPHPGVRVRDLELPRDVGHELQHGAEVAGAHAAGAVDDEGDVVGVQAGLAADQAVGVTQPLHQRLRRLPQSKPAAHGQREEAVGATHGLKERRRL